MSMCQNNAIENERVLRAMLDSVPALIYTIDEKGSITFLSKSWHDLTGINQKQGLGSGWLNFVHPDDKEKSYNDFLNAISTQCDIHSEFRIICADGQFRWVLSTAKPTYHSDGSLSGFIGSCIDITERKKLEAIVHESEKKFRNAFDFSAVGLVLATTEGHFMRVNRSFCELLGYTEEELMNKSTADITYPDDLQKSILKRDEALRGNISFYHMEKRYVHKSGRPVWVYLSNTLLRDIDGIPVFFIGQIQDLTQRKEAENELQRKNEELKMQKAEAIEANRLKSQFLANMSHELRTPLNSIIGFTTRVIKKCETILPKLQLDNLFIVQDEANHLLDLINGLLDYSKIEAGKMDIHIEEFDLVKVVNEVYAMVRPLMSDKNLIYKYEFNTNDIMPVKSDRIKIKQVLINLLSNAFKYSEKGTIRLSIDKTDNLYCIRIQDEGVGISAENIPYIFDEFRQIDGSYTRKVGGTGLGLSITKRFVELLGGKIEVYSTLGVGSCFTVYLPPLLQSSDICMEENAHQIPGADIKGKIVCIDDDPNAQKLYRQFLNDLGFETIAFFGHEDIVNRVQSIQPDVVVLDVLLPYKDGWDILAELKNNTLTSTIPVIMASVLSEKNLAYKLKADEYLVKPVSQEELINAITRNMTKKSNVDILVADDDINFLNLIHQYLSEEQIGCRMAKDGEDALKQMLERKPDLLLLDIMMPKMDGFTVLDEIRQKDSLSDIPVIVVTAKDLTRDEKDRLHESANIVIQKSGTSIEHIMDILIDQVKGKLIKKV